MTTRIRKRSLWNRFKLKTSKPLLIEDQGFVNDEAEPNFVNETCQPPLKRKIEIEVPDLCQRCRYNRASISVRNCARNILEFICNECKLKDPLLRDLIVKKKSPKLNIIH